MKNISIAVLALSAFKAAEALAQTAVTDTTFAPAGPEFSSSMAGIIFKLILSMVLIVGLIYLTTYLIKKVNTRAAGGGVVGDTIKVMGRTFISPKQSLYLVKIGRRYAVLGATESNLNKITELDSQEAEEFENRDNKKIPISGGPKFADILKGFIKQ